MILIIGRYCETHDYYLRHLAEESNGKAIFIEHPLNRFKGLKWLLYRIHNSGRINQKINLPGRKIWAPSFLNDKAKSILENEPESIIYFSGDHYSLVKMGLFDYLKKKYTKASLVFEFADIVGLYEKEYPYFSIENARKIFNKLLTFNRIDVEKYDLTLSGSFIPNYDDVMEDDKIPYSDVFFVGYEKGRLDELHHVFEKCTKKGLRCEFFIVGVDIDKQLYPNDIHYNQKLNYSDVLKYVKKTKCVVNIVQINSIGLTLRIFEAIGMGKLLITNQILNDICKISCEPMVINSKDMDNALNLLLSNSPVKWFGREHYTAEEWCSTLEKNIYY